MAADSLNKKVLSRRSLFTMAGGAAGLLIAQKVHQGRLGGKAGKVDLSSLAKAGAKKGQNVVKAPPEAEAKARGPVITKNEERGFQGVHVDEPGRLATASRPVLDMLSPLKPGVKVYGWTVVAIHDVHMGAVPVVLESKDGTRYQVDVLRRDKNVGAPQSVADTTHLSFFLANKGNGSKPSSESHGLGAIALATVLSRRMPKGLPASMLTWRERMNRFPNGDYNVPV